MPYLLARGASLGRLRLQGPGAVASMAMAFSRIRLVFFQISDSPSAPQFAFSEMGAPLTACGTVCGMEDPVKTSDEIKKAELRESVKQVLMHLLDDPQIQQKIVVLVQKQLRS